MTRTFLSDPAMTEATKTCSKCGQSKPHDAFYLHKGRLASACKPCHIAGVLTAKRKRREREQAEQQPAPGV